MGGVMWRQGLVWSLSPAQEIVLGELDVLTRIWESQAMLRRGKPSTATFAPWPAIECPTFGF